jgi:hypothetical protein
MIITLDTEDPALPELLSQVIAGRLKQHMVGAFSVASASGNKIELGGPNMVFVDALSNKLVESLISFSMLSQQVLSAEEVNGYTNSLITWIAETLKSQDPKHIESIRSLWDNEPWDSIQAKLSTEASTWHVWWMDGVRRYISIDRGWIEGEGHVECSAHGA